MPESVAPSSVEELRGQLAEAGAKRRAVELRGSFTKAAMGGPIAEADIVISAANLNRVAAYEPADLTVSVEAGITYKQLTETLAENNQFLPLDPPYSEQATIGGILATNCSGPRRRRYGSARDMLIGMEFATLEGKLVKSGGMVVKNVTGLDMGKLMIGSFGTLAAVARANFKVFPRPETADTLTFVSPKIEPLAELRRAIVGGVIQPAAIDWLSGPAAARAGLPGTHNLLVEVSGSSAAVARSIRELGDIAPATIMAERVENDFWGPVRNAAYDWMRDYPAGAVIRVSAVAANLPALLNLADALGCGALIRAGNAVAYVFAEARAEAAKALGQLREQGFLATVEASSPEIKSELELWRAPEVELEIMRRVKADFDPHHLLNRGRLYGVI